MNLLPIKYLSLFLTFTS
uniref:Uncharacterized protein n=1 Tax=Vitis vinifera TaxID=29760 RepID=F6GZ94_VITVI